MKKPTIFQFILIALLIGVTAFSLYKYLMAVKENTELSLSLNQVKSQALVLQNEKLGFLQELGDLKQQEQQAQQENSQLKDELKAGEDKIAELTALLEKVNSQLSILTAENTAISQENEKYKETFNSVTELKKAIRDLKIKIRQARRIAKLEEQIIGNAGFLIKDGQSTYPAKVKIEVQPLSK